MKLIEPFVTVVPYKDPFIHIERIGRTCYKSLSDFTHETGVKFFNTLVKSKHYSVLEHATFLFLLDPKNVLGQLGNLEFIRSKKYLEWTRVSAPYNPYGRVILSGNLRAIKESGLYILMTPLLKKYPELSTYFGYSIGSQDYSTEPFRLITREEFLALKPNQFELQQHLYTSIAFVTDRGVSHELVRHRPASFAQESTRYCNYSKDRFGNELEFTRPANFNSWTEEARATYLAALKNAEMTYLYLTAQGMSPQDARGILPTDVRTRIVMTANHAEWLHFFDLRSRGTTGQPHPNMKKVADMALKEYEKYNEV